jgi:hypothetical protein
MSPSQGEVIAKYPLLENLVVALLVALDYVRLANFPKEAKMVQKQPQSDFRRENLSNKK